VLTSTEPGTPPVKDVGRLSVPAAGNGMSRSWRDRPALGHARTRAHAHPARLQLLGGFHLVVDGGQTPIPVSGQRLLAFLALQPHPLRRAHVAGTLWPDTTDARSSANLRSLLWRIRHPGLRLLDATSTHVGLADDVAIDVHDMVATCRRLIDRSIVCRPDELDPLQICGELLPDWYEDDWVLIERERLRQLCLNALEALCERLAALGRYGEAVDAGLAAVRGEPLRESAHRALVCAHLGAGNHSEALRQYRWYRRLVLDELGLPPSDHMTQLMAPLLDKLPRDVS
jgi:DNA-binding SARP family transcriptional activator